MPQNHCMNSQFQVELFLVIVHTFKAALLHNIRVALAMTKEMQEQFQQIWRCSVGYNLPVGAAYLLIGNISIYSTLW